MYHLVHYGMAHSPARQRLLDAVVAKALSTGIGELSLRELAAAIGTSHRMLVYHFGSREGLLAAVTYEVESLARSALLRELTTDGDPRSLEAAVGSRDVAAGATLLRALLPCPIR